MVKSTLTLVFFLLVAMFSEPAAAFLCGRGNEECGSSTARSNAHSTPASRGGKIRVNPSAVPKEKGLGLELIYYDKAFDFALVKGLGRVGAAISPSNSEETFFGPPGIELPPDLVSRKVDKHKFPSQKYTLAAAFGLLDNKQSGLERFELNLGVMGKYNRLTKETDGGAGLTGVLGPLTFGYSIYNDQTQLDYTPYGLDDKPVTRYRVETYSIGLFLHSILIDYSVLRMMADSVATTTVLTGALLFKRLILTAALRRDSSILPSYNYATRTLDATTERGEVFGGVQVGITSAIMVGAFYNYYLMRETSLGLTVFF